MDQSFPALHDIQNLLDDTSTSSTSWHLSPSLQADISSLLDQPTNIQLATSTTNALGLFLDELPQVSSPGTLNHTQGRVRAPRQQCSLEDCTCWTAQKCTNGLCPAHCLKSGTVCLYHAVRPRPPVGPLSGTPMALQLSTPPSCTAPPEHRQVAPAEAPLASTLAPPPAPALGAGSHTWAEVLRPTPAAPTNSQARASEPGARPKFSTQMNPLWMNQRNDDIRRRQEREHVERMRKEKEKRSKQFSGTALATKCDACGARASKLCSRGYCAKHCELSGGCHIHSGMPDEELAQFLRQRPHSNLGGNCVRGSVGSSCSEPMLAGPSDLTHPVYQRRRPSLPPLPSDVDEERNFLAQLELAKALSASEAAREDDLFEARTALALSASLDDLATDPLSLSAALEQSNSDTCFGDESRSRKRRADDEEELAPSRPVKKLATLAVAELDDRPINWFDFHTSKGCAVCEYSESEDSDSDDEMVKFLREDTRRTLARNRTITPPSSSASPVINAALLPQPADAPLPLSLSTSPDLDSRSFSTPPLLVAQERMALRLENPDVLPTDSASSSSSSSTHDIVDLTDDPSDSEGPSTPASSSTGTGLVALAVSMLSTSSSHGVVDPPAVPSQRKPRVEITSIDIDLTREDEVDDAD